MMAVAVWRAHLWSVGVFWAQIAVRTDTRWWREWVVPYADIEYLPGRLKFGGAANSAPFPSMVVIFRP